jgi:hypothetical protein
MRRNVFLVGTYQTAQTAISEIGMLRWLANFYAWTIRMWESSYYK